MTEEASTEPEVQPGPRSPRGWAVTAVGGVLLLWAVLGMASAGYGSKPTRGFASRRSYNMVKADVHRAFPVALLRATGGLLLIFVGSRMRRPSES